jgi:bacterioferritin
VRGNAPSYDARLMRANRLGEGVAQPPAKPGNSFQSLPPVCYHWPIPTPRKQAMKGDPNIIRLLNAQLTNELTAVNQYFLHARMYQHWGFTKLGKKEYDESIGEMKHADKLIDRILMLDGLPNLQALHKLLIGEAAQEMLECDLKLERAAQVTVKEGIAASEIAADYVSRDLFLMILEDTEEHIDWLETQLDIIAKIGIQNYLQSQL